MASMHVQILQCLCALLLLHSTHTGAAAAATAGNRKLLQSPSPSVPPLCVKNRLDSRASDEFSHCLDIGPTNPQKVGLRVGG